MCSLNLILSNRENSRGVNQNPSKFQIRNFTPKKLRVKKTDSEVDN